MNMSETMVDAKKTPRQWTAKAFQDVSKYLRHLQLVGLHHVQSTRALSTTVWSPLISLQVGCGHNTLNHNKPTQRGMDAFFLVHLLTFLPRGSNQYRRPKVSLLHFFEASTSTVIAAEVNVQDNSIRQVVSTQQLQCNGSRRNSTAKTDITKKQKRTA